MDDERLGAGRAQRLGSAPHRLLVERDHHFPFGIHALGHLDAEIARDEGLERSLEAVRCGTRAASQLQHVPEAAGGNEPHYRALALEQRVRRRRRAVN